MRDGIGGILENFAEWIRGHTENGQVEAVEFHKDEATGARKFLINKGSHAQPRVMTIEPWAPVRNHTFDTLDGFLSYLNGPHCEKDNGGIIFVGSNKVHALLGYQKHGTHEATLPLKWSEEFEALLELTKGVSQARLFELMVTKLKDCLDDELMLIAGNLSSAIKNDSQMQISALGVRTGEARQAVKVAYKTPAGDQSEVIPTKWTFKGRMLECFDREVSVELVLQIDVEKGMQFKFYPQRLARIRSAHLLDLAAEVRGRTEAAGRFTVHEGVE